MKKNTNYFALFTLFAVVYLAVTFSIPPDPASLARYNLSFVQSRLISLSIALPLLAIWLAVFYGFAKLRDYAQSIKDSPDGQALGKMSLGLGVLAVGLPTASIVSAALNYFARLSPQWLPQVVMANNYLSIGFSAVGFTLIALGSTGLLHLVERKPSRNLKLALAVAFAVFAVVYVYLVLQNPYRTVPGPTGRATYFLPDWLIITTIALPYLYVWLNGLRAAFAIRFYQKNVQGTLYKQFLKYMAAGFTAVIISSISVQLLAAVGSSLSTWSLGALLGLIYLLLIVIAVGYILIAIGAKKLKKLEEV